MIKCYLLNGFFVCNFYKNLCVEFCIIVYGTATQDCVIKAKKMLSFLPLINYGVIIGLSITNHISNHAIK